jgi:pSer/pThr/pTyr-binding forkhead associated (FHA) protein
MPEFTLQIISGVQVGRKIRVSGPLTLGRSDQSGVCFAGPDATLVSSQHAALEIRGERLAIRDLGSTNGTYVNGDPVDDALLEPNAIISLGASGPKLRLLAPAGDAASTTSTLRPVTQTAESRLPPAGTQSGRNLKSPGFPSFGGIVSRRLAWRR